jgi:outer membrane protein OmpA-like peptidoglycan-associated protein
MKMYGLLFVMSLLAVLPACKKQKKSDPKQTTHVKKDKNKRRGSHDVEGYAFEDAQNFNLSGNDMENFAHSKKESLDQGFSWQDADIEKDVDGLEPVYFDFDKYNIKDDQKPVVKRDTEHAKKARKKGKTVVAEGHADHAAGSAAYNMVLSEKRAHKVAKEMEKDGVDKKCIKCVGRGNEMPKHKGGNKDEQWENRRVEIFTVN